MLGAPRLTPSTLKFGGRGVAVLFVCESRDGRFLRETRWKILCLNPWNSLLEFVFVWVHIREHVGPHTYIHIHKLFLYSDSLSIYIYIKTYVAMLRITDCTGLSPQCGLRGPAKCAKWFPRGQFPELHYILYIIDSSIVILPDDPSARDPVPLARPSNGKLL